MKEVLLNLLRADSLDGAALKAALPLVDAADIAELFDALDKNNILRLYRILPKDLAAEVFSEIEKDRQQFIVEALTDVEVGDMVNRLFVDDAVDFIEEMPANVVNRVLGTVNPEKRRVINQLLQYPDDSAGSIMTTEYIALRETAAVREAFDLIRATGLDKETIYTCYVIRQDRVLLGEISAKTLMLSALEDRIADLMDPNPVFVKTFDDQEAVAGLFKKYGLLAMPVVDREQRMVGIITVDDIVEVIDEEATEDLEKMNALNPSDDPYLKTSILRLARNRILWLLVLMLSATITGSIISGFEEALGMLPMLVAFIPMLMDTGGNAGAQASALIIRGMALDEIRFQDLFRVIWRELRIAALCGLALGAVNFVRIYLMNGPDLALACTVTLSLFLTVLMAKTIGCVLPLLARKIRLDPAIMAAPLITTIVDAASLLVYLSLARSVFFG
ncbi:MAG: magnesium transporter [Treponema sp.]|jgi:magnesium transporter|nr:magnesium transporter [Treponema sp.]